MMMMMMLIIIILKRNLIQHGLNISRTSDPLEHIYKSIEEHYVAWLLLPHVLVHPMNWNYHVTTILGIFKTSRYISYMILPIYELDLL